MRLYRRRVTHHLAMLLFIGITAACSPKPRSEAKGTVDAGPSTPAAIAVANPTCKEIWADTTKYLYSRSTLVTMKKGSYRAYRMLEFLGEVAPTGKWIGAFKNTSNQGVDPFPDDPGSNHKLEPGEKACLYMTHEKKTPFENAQFTARFEKENGQKARIRGLICGDGPDHDSTAVPEFKQAADQCQGRALQISVPIEGG